MLKDRDFQLRMSTIMRYSIALVSFLAIMSLFLPYFTYSGVTTKETQGTISILTYIGIPSKFPQLKILIKNLIGVNIKFISMNYMMFPMSTIIFGLVSIVVAVRKKGVGTSLFPLWVSIYGLCGYFVNNPFLSLGNHPASKAIQIAVLALLLIISIANVVINVLEIKSRPPEYYLPMME
jgi:hypothetical protein